MESLTRVVQLHDLLRGRRSPISVEQLQDQLACSRTTVQRTLTRLKDELHAPVEFVAGQGWQYVDGGKGYELPGFWLGTEDLAGLLVIDAILERLEGGVLQSQARLLRAQIDVLLGQAVIDEAVDATRVRERVSIVTPRFLTQRPEIFTLVCNATLHRKRLTFSDYARRRGEPENREVSPLRLFYFRDNWFLQAWCHATNASLIFALARLHHVAVSSRAAIAGAGTEVTGLRLVGEEPTRHRARLRFVPSAAAAVAGEHWHPEQVGQFATDGSYELIVPYAQTQDVLGHVLRHGANVVVESPKSLRRAVARALLRSLSLYPDLTTATPKRRSDG